MKQFYAYIHAKPDYTPFYVGKGSGNRSHKLSGDRNTRHNRTVAKYGAENILISKIECSTEAIAFDLERGLIKCLKRMGFSLTNMTEGGEGASGVIVSSETRAKLSAAGKRRVMSDAAKAKISAKNSNPSAEKRAKLRAASLGQVKSADTRAKISASKTNPSVESRAKMRAAKVGRKLSEEHKRKVSEAGMGRVCSPETREKLRIANTGQICTEEMRAKLIASHTGLPWSEKRREAYNKKWGKNKDTAGDK